LEHLCTKTSSKAALKQQESSRKAAGKQQESSRKAEVKQQPSSDSVGAFEHLYAKSETPRITI
jgi:hypothetical protein